MCDNLPELYEEHLRKARKLHVCCECKLNINPNKHYYQCTGKWDGEFQQYKQCVNCFYLFWFLTTYIDCLCFTELYLELYEFVYSENEPTKIIDELNCEFIKWIENKSIISKGKTLFYPQYFKINKSILMYKFNK